MQYLFVFFIFVQYYFYIFLLVNHLELNSLLHQPTERHLINRRLEPYPSRKSVRTVFSHLKTAKSFYRRQAALAALRAAWRARRVQRSTRCTRTAKAAS